MRVKVTRKEDDFYQSAKFFPVGTLIESRNGNQYVTMLGDNAQIVLVSLANNRVYGEAKPDGVGKSLSYKRVPFSQIVLEGE